MLLGKNVHNWSKYQWSYPGYQRFFSRVRRGARRPQADTSSTNFRRPLQSLLLRYTAENSQVTYFYYALSPCANTIFQKLTVFVYTESWSRDQVMKRAYYFNVVLTIQCPFSWYITIGFVSFLCLFNLPLLYESPSSAGHKKNFICSMLSGKDLSLSNTHWNLLNICA